MASSRLCCRTLGTKKEKRKKKADDEGTSLASLAPPGFKISNGASEIIFGNGLTEPSKHNSYTEKFYQLVNIQHDEAFTLKPLIMTTGPLADHPLLVLEPVAPFRFMDLPTEIRAMIFGYVFGDEETTYISSPDQTKRGRRRGFIPPWAQNTIRPYRYKGYGLRQIYTRRDRGKDMVKLNIRRPSKLSLLQVSKQFFQEAAPVAYNRKFTFENGTAVQHFLETIGSMRRHLKVIDLVSEYGWYVDISKASVDLLKDACDLRKVIISHRKFCADVHDRGLRAIIREIVTDISLLLKKLRNARRTESKSNVLDIVQIEHRPCIACGPQPIKDECQDMRRCGVECGDAMAQHCRGLTALIRSALAKELKNAE